MNAPDNDASQRFLFDQTDIRGDIVSLDQSLSDTVDPHDYSPQVRALMGEFLVATTLLAGTLKFSGSLILQVRSNGDIPLMMAQCTHDLGLRGIARGANGARSDDFDTLFAQGQLVLTIDPAQGERYQGIVPAKTSLAATINHYFAQSEQLPTRLWLSSDGHRAGGMLMQQLPAHLCTDPRERAFQWEDVCALGDTLTDGELRELSHETLLHRLFHAHDLSVFEQRPARFECTCSRERTRNALTALPVTELEELLEEQGHIDMDCEFCQQRYRFERNDLAHLLSFPESTTTH